MAYKNESLMIVANKYSKASGEARALLFETYDQLRDLTIAGPSIAGEGLGPIGSGLMKFAQLLSPAQFMPVFGSGSINIPGTSYSTPITGGSSVLPGGQAALGFGDLGYHPGFPTGQAAALATGVLGSLPFLNNTGNISNIPGSATGYAAALATGAGSIGGSAAGAGFGRNWVIPAAGVVAGVGGLLRSIAPITGPFAIGTSLTGTVASGISASILRSYQNVSQRLLTNADTILTLKVRNIEAVVKQLDSQTGIIQKMIKESIDGDSKVLQNL